MTTTLNEQEINQLHNNIGSAISKIEDNFNDNQHQIATMQVNQEELWTQIKWLKSYRWILENQEEREDIDTTDMKEIILEEKLLEKEELERDIDMLLLELACDGFNKAKSEEELEEDGAFIRELMAKVEKIDVVIEVLGEDLMDEFIIIDDLDDDEYELEA